MNTANVHRIETLKKDNFDTWKIQVEALLIKNDTWNYVCGKKAKPDTTVENSQERIEAWEEQDRKAKSDLILSISPSELKHVRGCETSHDVWKKLESVYASQGPARKATLLKRLLQKKMEDGDDVREHIASFFDAVDKLQAMDIDISGDLLTIMLLYSLPCSFENFRCAIESRDTLPSAESLKIKIIEESEVRKRASGETSGAMFARHQSARASKQDNARPDTARGTQNDARKSDKPKQPKYKCHYCGKPGHKAANCYSRNKKRSEQSESLVAEILNESTAQISNDNFEKNKWCLDSGCTSHLCKDVSLFTSTKSVQCGLKLASDATVPVSAKGNVEIEASNGTVNRKINLENTLYVPKLRTNLISISRIVDRGNTVVFEKNRATVSDKNGNVKLLADRKGDLFFLRNEPVQVCAATEEITEIRKSRIKSTLSDAEEWHRRLGHLNSKDTNIMMKNECVKGLKFNETVDSRACSVCLTGKLTSAPFTSRHELSQNPLEIVHTDLCGPMRTVSNGGSRYFLTFIDDYSRWTEIYFLKNKSEVTAKFIEYKNMVENQTGRKIKCVQSDNGREFVNEEMNRIFKNAGIRRRLTTVHTPQQNGVAERANRTLVESARCMMIESGLSASFWAEAVATANHIRNRCVTRALNKVTPFEKWSGSKPNIHYLRSFGVRAFVLNKNPNKNKFESRAIKGTFVGYSDSHKAYRVWIPNERKIRISRDVRFLDEFESEKSFEDFIDDQTLGTKQESTEESELNVNTQDIEIRQIEANVDDNEPIDLPHNEQAENRQEINANPEPELKRGPGRPKKVFSGRVGRPLKQYNMIPVTSNAAEERNASNENTLPQEEDSESTSDDDRWYNAGLVMNCSEFPLQEAISGPDSEEWKHAIFEEIKSLVSNDTWQIVSKPTDAKIISCRTVLRNKMETDGTIKRRKARVVARGFCQKPGIDFKDSFAPVARLNSFRLLMALSIKYDMKVSQLDVTCAYLNGQLEEEVYMDLPEFLPEMLKRIIAEEDNVELVRKAKVMLNDLSGGNKICKLEKSLYGLRQAGRQWYATLQKCLDKMEYEATKTDPCVFVNKVGPKSTMILVYVDDILIASKNEGEIKRIVDNLSKRFDIKDLGDAKHYLGIEIERTNDELTLSQTSYIREILKRFHMQDCKPVGTPLSVGAKLSVPESCEIDEREKYPFKQLIGALMYVAIGTRPDIAHAVTMLSQFNNNYSHTHWTAAKHVLRYLQGTTNLSLHYKKGNDKLSGFVDADWGNCGIDRKSFTGYSFILGGAAITWASKKQRTVALSSTESEYLGLTDAAKEAIYLLNFLKELGFSKLADIELYNDNQGAGKLALNPVFHARTKHFDIRVHFIREAVKKYPIKIVYVPSEDMTADVLTKALPKVSHNKCIKALGLHRVEQARI